MGDRLAVRASEPACDGWRDGRDVLAALASTLRYHRGQEICGEEGSAKSWYRVLSGMARRYAVRPSGRRQIVGLLIPGDLFGFPVHDEYTFAIEAVIEGTMVACYPRQRIEMLADTDARLARTIRDMSFEAIARLQEQVFILGRTTSLKKVGSFLLRMAARFSDGPGGSICLPMSRYDIADYLGLSVETVSRCLTTLKRRGVIRFSGTRRVTILDREALEEGDSLGSPVGTQDAIERWDEERPYLASNAARAQDEPDRLHARRGMLAASRAR